MRQSVPATIGVVLAAILALSGLVISGVLLQHHVAIQIGGDRFLGGLCKDVAGTSTCDAALTSKWGQIGLGKDGSQVVIPTAMLGFVFFACMASWYIVIGRPNSSRRGFHVLPLVGAAIGALISVFLDIIMWTRLAEPCWLCFATHVITWVLLLLTLLLWPRRGRISSGPVVAQTAGGHVQTGYKTAAEMPYPPMHLLLGAVLLAVATSAAGWSTYQWRLRKAYANEYFARWQEYDKDYAAAYKKFTAQPQVKIPIMPDDPIRGPVDAPHTVVVFSDFQCPFCKYVASVLDERRKEFPGKFRIVFKYFPMNKTCNDYIKNTLHPASCAAAVTAEAARLMGGAEMFWKMHDELFRDPEGFAKDPQGYARQACEKLGLSNDELWKKIKTYSIWEHIRVDAGQGNAIGVDSTPTLYFDGRRMTGWGDKHTWRFLVEGQPPTATGPAQEAAPAEAVTKPAEPVVTPKPTTRPVVPMPPPRPKRAERPATNPSAAPVSVPATTQPRG